MLPLITSFYLIPTPDPNSPNLYLFTPPSIYTISYSLLFYSVSPLLSYSSHLSNTIINYLYYYLSHLFLFSMEFSLFDSLPTYLLYFNLIPPIQLLLYNQIYFNSYLTKHTSHSTILMIHIILHSNIPLYLYPFFRYVYLV